MTLRPWASATSRVWSKASQVRTIVGESGVGWARGWKNQERITFLRSPHAPSAVSRAGPVFIGYQHHPWLLAL